MIRLDLEPHEQDTLADLMEVTLADLRMLETVRDLGRTTEDGLGQEVDDPGRRVLGAEISHTDSKDYREMLKTRKRVIHKTLEALGRPVHRPLESQRVS